MQQPSSHYNTAAAAHLQGGCARLWDAAQQPLQRFPILFTLWIQLQRLGHGQRRRHIVCQRLERRRLQRQRRRPGGLLLHSRRRCVCCCCSCRAAGLARGCGDGQQGSSSRGSWRSLQLWAIDQRKA